MKKYIPICASNLYVMCIKTALATYLMSFQCYKLRYEYYSENTT